MREIINQIQIIRGINRLSCCCQVVGKQLHRIDLHYYLRIETLHWKSHKIHLGYLRNNYTNHMATSHSGFHLNRS